MIYRSLTATDLMTQREKSEDLRASLTMNLETLKLNECPTNRCDMKVVPHCEWVAMYFLTSVSRFPRPEMAMQSELLKAIQKHKGVGSRWGGSQQSDGRTFHRNGNDRWPPPPQCCLHTDMTYIRNAHVYIYMYVYMHLYMYIDGSVYIYIHTHIYTCI